MRARWTSHLGYSLESRYGSHGTSVRSRRHAYNRGPTNHRHSHTSGGASTDHNRPTSPSSGRSVRIAEWVQSRLLCSTVSRRSTAPVGRGCLLIVVVGTHSGTREGPSEVSKKAPRVCGPTPSHGPLSARPHQQNGPPRVWPRFSARCAEMGLWYTNGVEPRSSSRAADGRRRRRQPRPGAPAGC